MNLTAADSFLLAALLHLLPFFLALTTYYQHSSLLEAFDPEESVASFFLFC